MELFMLKDYVGRLGHALPLETGIGGSEPVVQLWESLPCELGSCVIGQCNCLGGLEAVVSVVLGGHRCTRWPSHEGEPHQK